MVLENATHECVVIPRLGRVMSYRRTDGTNILWNDPSLAEKIPSEKGEYLNFGGDKLWSAPQHCWHDEKAPWPPPFGVDQAGCVAVIEGEKIILEGKPGIEEGVRFIRSITMKPDGSLSFENTIENASDRTVSWAVWDITQVLHHSLIFGPYDEGPGRVWDKDDCLRNGDWTMKDGVFLCKHASSVSGKVFFRSGRGWLAMRNGRDVFVKSFQTYPASPWPEQHGNIEVYVCPAYIEMESLGPRVPLAPGQRFTMREEWTLRATDETWYPDRLVESFARWLRKNGLV
jgi:hypothetical protein